MSRNIYIYIVQSTGFDTMKRLVFRETLLSHPSLNVSYKIHTEASKLQLGSVISEKGKPHAFHSRELNPIMVNYTTTECDLFSTMGTVKEFRNILGIRTTNQCIYRL